MTHPIDPSAASVIGLGDSWAIWQFGRKCSCLVGVVVFERKGSFLVCDCVAYDLSSKKSRLLLLTIILDLFIFILPNCLE